ncbi:MAG: ORF6N domain-containing protein [Chitinophagales bacterium]|jgi:hypothetical protein|nr:ORF6N domain-containing protein [Sphingobacteriales bacterium]
MLDFDLSELYEIETRVLNQAVKRNINRFPQDFMFQLNEIEFTNLKSQFVTSRWGGTRKLPFAFTEQGVAMLSSVLHSSKAIEVNISIMRAFVYFRQLILSNKQLSNKLVAMEEKYNKKFKDVFEALNYLLNKDKQVEEVKVRTKIGFRKP